MRGSPSTAILLCSTGAREPGSPPNLQVASFPVPCALHSLIPRLTGRGDNWEAVDRGTDPTTPQAARTLCLVVLMLQLVLVIL